MKKSVLKIFSCGLLATLLFNSSVVFAAEAKNENAIQMMMESEANNSPENVFNFSGEWVESSVETTTKRLYGGNNTGRYETAVAISKEKWANGSDTIVLVTGMDYPDALSATPLAAKHSAPILLTENKKLPQSVKAEIKRLSASNAIIVGGNGAVSKEVETELKAMGVATRRIDGKDRYNTAVNIAKEIGTENGIAVAYGLNYADALSIAPVAGKLSMPIILTPSNYMNEDVKKFIASTEINETVIVGGVGAISYEVASAFPNPMRIGGQNRFETNINVLSIFGNWLNYDEVYVATGMNYPDALSGSAAAAMTGSPLILASAYEVDDNTAIYANFLRAKKVYGLGGQAILSNEVLSYIGKTAQYFDIQNIKSKPITINKNQFAILPSAVFVLPDGKTINQALPKIVEIQWQTEDLVIDTSIAGEKIYTGVVKGHDINDDKYKVELKVIVK